MGSIPTADRDVREALVSRGAQALTDRELLSIVIGEGAPGQSALEVADRLLADFDNSLPAMARAGIARLRMTAGIGIKRAAQLVAFFEISDRLRRAEAAEPSVIRTKEDVVALFGPLLARVAHEEMWVVYLTSANTVIEKTRVGQGGVTSVVVDHKLIVKRAIELLASSVIIVHNHPSGVCLPSGDDVATTERIAAAAALFDIAVIDHIIITDSQSYSFRQHGLLK